jgi:UDP-glucuronate decarboxylase
MESENVKVLITGGYGFIGSHVAERFSKEGHDIYIIDNMTNGNKKNISFKHKSYVLSVEDKKCEEIFKMNKFDVVVHLAAQTCVGESVNSPVAETKSDVIGLVNILHWASKYKVKKLIFASSSEVYGNNTEVPLNEESILDPLSPYGLNKLIGELYCRKWKEVYGLDTVCFRLSSVYGPRQGSAGEGGIVSAFIQEIIKGHEIFVYGDESQTRDFIYVEDVADAIYKAAKTDITGVYNLSTNTGTSINMLIDILKSQHGIRYVVCTESKQGDITHSCLENKKLKKTLDWVPMHIISEGIEKTFEWCSRNHDDFEQEHKASIKEKVGRLFQLKYVPYVENILGIIIVALLSMFSDNGIMYSSGSNLVFYIVLIGVVYGSKQSMISVLLSCLVYLYSELKMGREALSLIYDTGFLFQIGYFIIIGLAVGYSIDKKDRSIVNKDNQLTLLTEKYEFLKDVHDETRAVKEELQNQIINSENSFGKIYDLTRQLDSLEPEKIFHSAVNVTETIMKNSQVSIYFLNKTGKHLRLIAKSNKADFEVPESIRIRGNKEFLNVIEKREIYTNAALTEGFPIMMAPITQNDKVVAVAALHNVDFDSITLYYKNLFQILVGLVSASINNAYRYEEELKEKKYLQGTVILRSEYFKNILSLKKEAREKYEADYTMLRVENNQKSLQKLSGILENNIRETDYVGYYKDKPCLLLSNVNKKDVDIITRRLIRCDIECSIIYGET